MFTDLLKEWLLGIHHHQSIGVFNLRSWSLVMYGIYKLDNGGHVRHYSRSPLQPRGRSRSKHDKQGLTDQGASAKKALENEFRKATDCMEFCRQQTNPMDEIGVEDTKLVDEDLYDPIDEDGKLEVMIYATGVDGEDTHIHDGIIPLSCTSDVPDNAPLFHVLAAWSSSLNYKGRIPPFLITLGLIWLRPMWNLRDPCWELLSNQPVTGKEVQPAMLTEIFIWQRDAWTKPDHIQVSVVENFKDYAHEGGAVNPILENVQQNMKKHNNAIVGKLIGRNFTYSVLNIELSWKWAQFGFLKFVALSNECF
ncbi:uncharacterized protein LOC110018735 [Phalaenopsis equestris]|uniref:uncharacterized protein LOC110018735 n=1 Tax=Phalaenopsis equestris TaxID=78828 RepID=UPI0009E4FB1D|nr:uncharacterized protein LOC110018735 [Phalaenopsis equestris]